MTRRHDLYILLSLPLIVLFTWFFYGGSGLLFLARLPEELLSRPITYIVVIVGTWWSWKRKKSKKKNGIECDSELGKEAWEGGVSPRLVEDR